ncbi:Bgt-51674 [Blumeria graminis f. sp. tritici]|uniref:Bgt-51674 n=1 Tax=Blumeria graminis f. sp. tritici TaxID=62690 RepID=A0A9X9MEJ9_BLUGR|nr:Bgt-51674 [Blumeria graminis f. sp. tritici]
MYEFTKILKKFTPSFKELKKLAKNLRMILFEADGGYKTAPKDRRSLYRRMIEAFDDTIEDIRGKTYLSTHDSILLFSSSFADKLFTLSWKDQESNFYCTLIIDYCVGHCRYGFVYLTLGASIAIVPFRYCVVILHTHGPNLNYINYVYMLKLWSTVISQVMVNGSN